VTVQPTPLEFGTMLHQINHNTIVPASCLAWVADYLDPQDFYSLLLTSTSPENHNGYKNVQLDALCAQADVAPSGPARDALYQRVGVIATEDPSRIPLLYESDIELIKPYVHGVDDCLMGHLPFKKVSFVKH
jgi:oligopeptide transport system substrate-binding protein